MPSIKLELKDGEINAAPRLPLAHPVPAVMVVTVHRPCPAPAAGAEQARISGLEIPAVGLHR